MMACVKYSLFLLFYISFAVYNVFSAYSSPLMAFFFDARAVPVDADGNGGDDYVSVQFDVDLDEDKTSNVTVIAKLYNAADKAVATGSISYQITGQEEDYERLSLTPSPNIEGTYYLHLSLSDLSDELYIENIYYNPTPGSDPVAYFAEAAVSSEMNVIEVELDVNIVQEMASSVRIDAVLMNYAGELVSSKNLNYITFFDDTDYKHLSFIPPDEDAYSVLLWVYPGGSELATDSNLLEVLWPPGTGAYFRSYEAIVSENRIDVTFNVDLYYDITYAVSVEAILFDSNNDLVGYDYVSYLTYGSLSDKKTLTIFPEQTSSGPYYAKLTAYVEGYVAAYGYIEEIPYGQPPWDLNRDGAVDLQDLLILSLSFGKKTSELKDPGPDINGDGIVDLIDLVVLAAHYGERF